MKRILSLLICALLLMGCLCIPVSAESAASNVNLMATVNSEGDCLVTMTVNLRLEANVDKLYFPLPLNAKNITLNGSNVTTTRSSSATLVNISKLSEGYLGELAMRFEYTLPEAVKVTNVSKDANKTDWQLVLEIPLLSGFDYPVESLSFTITMPPGKLTNRPTLTSIYRQTSIESEIPFQVAGSQIIGSTKTVMNDHEGVTLTMIVPEEMFPTVSTYVREGNPELPYIIIFAVLALLYWILTLRTWPIIRMQTTTPPEGITAGEMGCRLTLAGGDLTMMVFTWAQLGYLRIMVDRKGRVILEKRMEMGNERSDFEIRTFRSLFGKADFVDATGAKYAKLCRYVAETVSGVKEMYTKRAGNVKIFRVLGCGISIFCGICFAMNMSNSQIIRTMLSIVFVIFGATTAWGIQGGMYKIHVRGKIPVYVGSVCGLIWIVLGIIAGEWIMGVATVAAQYLIGLLAAYGGRRSELGMYNASQILGLRSYLRKLDEKALLRLTDNNPDYFFDMLPYAIALGVDTKFAKAFGKMEIPECHYLLVARNDKRTAADWALLVRKIADQMDKRQRRLELEKWLPLNVRFY